MVRAILLSGEHPTLPAAELRALLAVHAPGVEAQVHGVVGQVPAAPGVEEALSRMALAHAWGEHWGTATDEAGGHAVLAQYVAQQCDGQGSVAVVTERVGQPKSPHSQDLRRMLGQAAAEAGHRIDLVSPDMFLYAWMADRQVHLGRLLGRIDRSAFEARISERRMHFSPVSMHPRRAASLVHLARVPPGGRLYDPFCGTGGILLEAALDGMQVLGSDRDPWMVQGSMQTLTDVGPEPLDAEVFVADIGEVPDLVGPVDGIVTDLPYGRASGTDREPVATLYARALEVFATLLPVGGHAVIGCAEPDLLAPAGDVGLEKVEHHEEFVHKGLTRHFVTLKKRKGVEGSP